MAERTFVYTPAMVGLTARCWYCRLSGLALVLQEPRLDVHWEHHPAHFWLVLLTAALSAVLAYTTGAAALRRGDARVLFVSLAFLSAAGFLGLHALATPKVLLDTPNAGFTLATPIGVALGVGVRVPVEPDRLGHRVGRAGCGSVCSCCWPCGRRLRCCGSAPLHAASVPEVADGILTALAVPAVLLYGVAAARYLRTLVGAAVVDAAVDDRRVRAAR